MRLALLGFALAAAACMTPSGMTLTDAPIHRQTAKERCEARGAHFAVLYQDGVRKEHCLARKP